MRGLLILLTVTVAAAQSAQADKITDLPGGPFGFDQYSGYLEVDAATGTRFFYWLQESMETSDSITIFFNGGPGCSSLGAALSETGAFFPGPNGSSIDFSATAWNRNTNMLYIEASAGVGFSVGTGSSMSIGDETFGKQVALAIIQFMKRFPKFLSMDLYYTGESYAGHYVPNVVAASYASGDPAFANLKGIALGNPTTNITDDFFYGTYRSWFANGLISPLTWASIERECFTPGAWLEPPRACSDVLDRANAEQGNINPYDIDAPVCVESKRREAQVLSDLLHHHRRARGDPRILPWRPCEGDWLHEYLNRPEIRSAIHADPSVPEWNQCTNNPDYRYHYEDFYHSQIPFYVNMAQQHPDVKVIIYSGLADTVVPYLGTQEWVYRLNGPNATKPWTPWSVQSQPQQTAGYVVEWPHMSFVVVRGAAHMVPESNPLAGAAILNYLINGTLA